MTDESTLITKIALGDPIALTQLYDRYGRLLYSVVFKMLGSVEESEEVVLDVFIQVWKTAPNYEHQRGRVDVWLFMMTRSRALDRLRRLQRLQYKQKVACQELLSPVKEESSVLEERRAHIHSALAQIPQEQQQVLDLAYFKGMTHPQIALYTQLPLGTVKSRLRLGLNKLRALLKEYGEL